MNDILDTTGQHPKSSAVDSNSTVTDYGADSIRVLRGLDAVRKRARRLATARGASGSMQGALPRGRAA